MKVEFSHVNISEKNSKYNLIYRMLPDQGCIEFQRDSPNKEHKWHQHANNETLLIIEGELNFYYDDQIQICKPGDVIHLSSMVRHQSIASSQGCVYAIATTLIDFNS